MKEKFFLFYQNKGILFKSILIQILYNVYLLYEYAANIHDCVIIIWMNIFLRYVLSNRRRRTKHICTSKCV